MEEAEQPATVRCGPEQVPELIDRADRPAVRDVDDDRIANLRPQQVREVSPRDSERSIPHPDRFEDGLGRDPQRVVQLGQLFVGSEQRSFTLPPVLGSQDAHQGRCERWCAGQPGECRTEPLGVRRVLPLHQEAQPHQVRHQLRPDERGPQLVLDEARPADQVELRVDPPPPRQQQVQPHVAWVVPEPIPHLLQPDLVVEHLAGREHQKPVLGQREPVPGVDLGPDIESQLLLEVALDREHLDGHPAPPEVLSQVSSHTAVDRLAQLDKVAAPHEDLDARLPVMVRRHLVVEAEHLRTSTQQGRAVSQAGEDRRQQRRHPLTVELPGEPQAGNEGRHNPILSRFPHASIEVATSPAPSHARSCWRGSGVPVSPSRHVLGHRQSSGAAAITTKSAATARHLWTDQRRLC